MTNETTKTNTPLAKVIEWIDERIADCNIDHNGNHHLSTSTILIRSVFLATKEKLIQELPNERMFMEDSYHDGMLDKTDNEVSYQDARIRYFDTYFTQTYKTESK